jgi:hypothetical protein
MPSLPRRPTPRFAAWPLAVALWVASASGALAAEATLAYTVTPHDTLIGLGKTLLVNPASWPEVARLNALRDPNRITPGQTLQVPFRLLRSAQVPARIVSVEGSVTLDGQAAKAGDAVQPGQVLGTSASSSAVLALGDGSRVKLAPLSETRLDEHRRFDLRANADSAGQAEAEGVFATTMRLARGAVEVLASKVLRAKPLEVTTPTAVIGVRGTEFRVRHAEATSATEVLEGRVHADAQGAAGADVPAGFGAALQAGRAPEVVSLPAAPDLAAVPARFERPVLRFALPGETLPLRVQIAADAGFDRVLRDETVAPGAETRIAGLADGTWHLRVRRIDSHGVEGFDSRRELLLKARPEPPAVMGPRAQAKQSVGSVPIAWAENTEASRYRLEVARDTSFKDVVERLDSLAGAHTQVSLAEPGVYFWRMASVRADGDTGPWGDARSFELRPLPEPPAGGLSGDGQTLDLRWSGRPQDHQQVELARDPAFDQVIARDELAEAHWQLPRPEMPGNVYFRYRSVESDGFASPWSSTLKIEVPRGKDWLYLLLPLLLAL